MRSRLASLSIPARLGLGFATADIAVGAIVLLGWVFGLSAVTSLGPGPVAMKPNVALSLGLLGGTLVLDMCRPASIRASWVRNVLALAVVTLMLATLLEYAAGANLGIDEALFREQAGLGTPYPGRPPIPVALALSSAALGTFLLGKRWFGYHPSQVLAAATGLVGALIVLGYAFGAQELTSIGAANRTSFLAGPALLLLGGAVLAANPDHGLVRQVLDPGPAGQVTRRIGPAALLIVPLGALIRIEGEKAGLYDMAMGVTLMTVFEAFLLVAVGIWTAARITAAEAARAEVTRDRDRFFDLSSDLILVTDLKGLVLQMSPSWETAVGRPRSEMLGQPFLDFVHPDDRAQSAGVFEDRVVAGPGVSGFANRYLCADGSSRWLEWSTRADLEGGRIYAAARDVTEQRQTEEILRERSAYARGLLESSLDPLVTISPAGKITDLNRATEEVTGRSREQLVGTDFADYFTEPGLAREGYQRVLRNGLVRDYPLTILHKSGQATDVLYNATVYRDEKGELQGVFAAARDVTEQKRAAEVTLEASLYTRSLLEASLDPLVTISPDGKVTDVNGATELATGRSREQLVGTDFADYFTEPGLAREGYQRVLRDGLVRDYPLTILHKSGSTTEVLYNATVYRNQKGELQGVFAAARDVTQLRRLVSELEKREEVLREQAGLLELAHDAILVRGLDGMIHFWNAGAERMYGWTQSEAAGRITHQLLKTVFPESLAALERSLIQTGSWEGQLRHTTRDGRRLVVESRQALERDQSGKPLAVLEINRDVTEAVAAHERLEQSAQELRRSNSELEQFAYVASHDLQEPLRMVTGFVGLLQRRYAGQLGTDADEYIGFAVEGAHRMQNLINDLLVYSRVGTRGQPLEPTDLAAVLDEVTANLRVAIDESHARIRRGKLPVVQADRHQMVQLFQNLIGNAIKFHGDAPPDVKVGSKRAAHGWELYVQDNGIGIDPKHLDQVFVIFRRLHSREAYPGNGIGLAICKKIVERHGGRIWIESEPGRGSTFRFNLSDAAGSGDEHGS